MVLLTRDIVVSVLLVELENNAKKVWAEFELELPGSGSEWRLNNYWKCSENFPTLSKGSSHIERFHSRGQQLCKFIGTKEGVCRRKEFKSHRIGLGHQHGRRFIVWDTNMAAVTSCENTLFQCTLPNMNTLEQLFFWLYWGLCEADLQAPTKCVRGRYFAMSGMPSNRKPRETTGYPKCLRIVSIKYTLHLFSFIFPTEKWEKLNSVPLCYGARDDAYGEFAFSKAGMIMKLTLTHINGFLSCNPMFPASHWGCDHPSLTQGKLMTLVTFENRTRLQPARIFGTPCNPQYSINGSSLNSTSLSFEPFDIPLAAPVDDNFQIWFGQDFTNCSEENNAGVICVDVYALYSWAVSKMYQSPVREKKECACCYCCCYCLWWWWWQRQKKKN